MRRATILKTAEKCVSRDRAKVYGDVQISYEKVAALWSAYLGFEVSAEDALSMMALLKLVRAKTGKAHADNYVDACGYAALAGEVALSSPES